MSVGVRPGVPVVSVSQRDPAVGRRPDAAWGGILSETTNFSEPGVREWTPWDVWRIIVKRRWLIANFALVALVIAGVLAFTLTPIFRATSKISIERKGVRILENDMMALESGREAWESFYNTQYQILQTDAIFERAIDKLQLEDRPRFALDGEFFEPGMLSKIKKDVVSVLGQREQKTPDARKFYRKWIEANLTISPNRNTTLVDIHFDSKSAEVAAEVANAIAQAYIDFSLEKKLDIARQSENFISERIFELRKEIAEEERQLQDYARRHGIVTGDDHDVARQHLNNLQMRYTESLGETAARKAAYISARTADPNSLSEVRQHPLVSELSRRVAQKEEDFNIAVQTYGPAYPQVEMARQALEDTQNSLEEHTQRISRQVVEARQEAFQEAEARTRELAKLIDEAKARVDELEGSMIEYEQLRFSLDRKKTTLQDLLSRRNDMLLAASMGEDTAHNVRVINSANVPDDVHSPNKKRMLALGLLLGLMLGVGCSVLLEAIDDTLKTADDVTLALDLLVVGEIPDVTDVASKKRSHRKRAATAARSDSSKKINPALVTVAQPRSAAAEAYRELRTAVLTARSGEPLRTLVVTSSEPGEGKTTTAINLAAALGQMGRTVLLIDTDLRRPNCHRILRVRSERGVSSYLKQGDAIAPLIVPTQLGGVSLLPSGPVPPDPAELLDSARFKQLLEDAKTAVDPATGKPFDHIVFDAPPVLSVIDPVLIGRHVDGGLLVLKSGVVRRKSAMAARHKLHVGRVDVMGAVLNALQLEDGRYGYRYYYYYASDTADGGRKKKRTSDSRPPDEPGERDERDERPALEAHPGGRSRSQA